MIRENSFGVIPLKYTKSHGWEMLLIQHHAGHWAFPKGHADGNETPQEAASRELSEETGLSIKRFLSETPLEEHYFFTFQGQKISKTVQYFIAEVTGRVKIQEAEIKDSHWFPLEKVMEHITFPEGKRLCHQVQQFLLNFKN